ncbi:MAG: MoaD/ThiS family protein [Pseudohongiella nitratireducens]|nr:MoaD/ThiS family protein [Pseudohongiella nitratireducens]
MPKVEMTSHLYRFFPVLADRELVVPAGSVASVLAEIDHMAPGFSDYIVDERGALRRHVNISVNDTVVIDKKTLSDRVPEDGTVYIFQALSGG